MAEGLIFDAQRFSLQDGEGLRTLVFLKGCPLRCGWCSNPESQSPYPEIVFDAGHCQGCGECRAVCPSGALTWGEGGAVVYRRELCQMCCACVQACAYGARRVVGRWISVAKLMEEVERDTPFFRRSGGGLTLGGGEPLYQPAFTLDILTACREQRIHTALETCGYAPWRLFAEIAPYVDQMLFDLKHIDHAQHQRLTGVSNRKILDNLKRLTRVHPDVTVRYPLVPGCNDADADILGLARWLKGLERMTKVEIVPYHRYGEPKYQMLGRHYRLGGVATPDPARVAWACELVCAQGLDCGAVP